jgi:hypothetical protein
MRELKEHPGWEALMELVQHGRRYVYERLEASPTTLTDATYSRHIGWLAGLAQLPDIVEAVLVKAERVREEFREAEEAVQGG